MLGISLIALLAAGLSGGLQIQQTQPIGQVVDATTGRPIAGADVAVVGVRSTTRTAHDGRFRWPVVPDGSVVVVVMLPEGRIAKPVTIAAGERLHEMVVKIEVAYGESVSVQGVAPGIDATPGASSTTVLEADLQLRRPATLAQSLENIPGVSAISEGQGSTPAIRGLARGRTVILVDGARVSTERGAGPNASFLDPATSGRIDVVRGPASVAYGTDAFGGVIAARSRWPVPSAGFDVRFSASAAAGQPEQRADVELAYGYDGGAILAGVRQREFENYTAPAGDVPYSSWRDSGGRVLWKQTAGANNLSAALQMDEARDIGRPRSDSNAVVASSPFERSTRFAFSLNRATLGTWRDLQLDAFVGASSQRTEQDRVPAPGRPRRIDRADASAQDFQIRSTVRHDIGPADFRGGLDFQRRSDVTAADTAVMFTAAGAITSTATTATIASADRTAFGGFGEADVPIKPWLRVTGGARIDGLWSQNDGGFFGDRSITGTGVAGVAAVTFAPSRTLSVTAQIARGFREPTLTDRFSRGPVGRGFIEGNPDLVPETSRQYDVTLRYAPGRFQITSAFYWYDIHDLIERYTAGPDLFRIRNRAHARLTGAELEARFRAPYGLTIDLVGQVSRGEDADDGTPVDDVAPESLSLIGRHVWRERLTSYVRLSSVGAHNRAGPGEVPSPGYTLLDAAAGWRLHSMVEVRATFRNLLNESYYSSAGPRWVWAPGRTAAITLVISTNR